MILSTTCHYSTGWGKSNPHARKKTGSANIFSNYKVWKNKLRIWKIVCVIPRKEQGILVLLRNTIDNKKGEKAIL